MNEWQVSMEFKNGDSYGYIIRADSATLAVMSACAQYCAHGPVNPELVSITVSEFKP